MAFTSVKPVVSHCAVEASMPKSCMTAGNAGVTTVWFSTVVNVPNMSTASMNNCFLSSPNATRSPSLVGCCGCAGLGCARQRDRAFQEPSVFLSAERASVNVIILYSV